MSVPGWNMPGWSFRRGSTARRDLAVRAARVVQIEGACSERAGGGDGKGTGSEKSRGDVQCGTAVTAIAPVVEAGDRKDGNILNSVGDGGASVEADGGCGVATVPESGELIIGRCGRLCS